MFRTISTVLAGLLCIAVAGIMGIVTAPTPTVADSTVQVEDTDSDVTLEELDEEGEIGEPLYIEDEWPDTDEPVDPDVPTQEEIDNGDVSSEVHEFPADYDGGVIEDDEPDTSCD